jgi:hypothetical protein
MSSTAANISRAYNFPEQVQTVARFVEFVQSYRKRVTGAKALAIMAAGGRAR